jgi:serine phosphatase RsbU (regulator of sigma subunit)
VSIGVAGEWLAEGGMAYHRDAKEQKKNIRQYKNKSSQEVVQAIRDALPDHRQTAAQQDDITMVVIKKV